MCARYDVIHSAEELARELHASLAGDIPPRTTIAPTDVAPVLVKQPHEGVLTRTGVPAAGTDGSVSRSHQLVLGPMRFGWTSDRPKQRIQVNVRSETAARAPRSRDAARTRRCLVPITAFHEWSGEKKARVHHVLSAEDGALMTLAGFYEIEQTDEGKRSSFVILTAPANDAVRPIHDRMPLVVPPELRDAWLGGDREADVPALIERVREAGAPSMIDAPEGPPPGRPKR